MPSLVETVTEMIKPAPAPTRVTGGYDLYDDYQYNEWLRGRGYSYGYGGYNGSKTPASSQVSTLSKTNRKIEVTYANGERDRWSLPFDGDPWWEIAKDIWPITVDKFDEIMAVPEAHCLFSYGEPKFNACVYQGTTDYLQARWGRKLDDSDRRWLAAHPLATDGGIPQEYTATCIDQLVTPYGMRVSRVRIRKGALVLGDSIMGWLMALGCNPMALADRNTSNADAAAALGLPVEQANQLWRVEFHDEPLPCSIVGERGWSSGGGVSTGSFGGHCRYLAPRASAGDWFISVQLDMDTQVQHLVPPPNPEYVPRKGAPTLLYGQITGPDNTLIAIKVNNTWSPASGGPVHHLTPPATTGTPPATTPAEDDNTFNLDMELYECVTCGSRVFTDELMTPEVCIHCVTEAWQGYRCPHCDEVFGDKHLPDPVGADEHGSDWTCKTCKGLISMDAGNDPALDEICAVIFDTYGADLDMPHLHPEDLQ